MKLGITWSHKGNWKAVYTVKLPAGTSTTQAHGDSIPDALRALADDIEGVDRGERTTDGRTILACPDCDDSDVYARTQSMDSTADDAPRYRCGACGERVAARLVEDGICPACEGDDGPDPRLVTDGAGGWYETETLSNPDGSMDVHYCWDCGHMMADETVEEVDACPSCGYSDDRVES